MQWQCLINPELPHSIKSVDLGKKYHKKHLKQNNLHESLSFEKLVQKIIKIMTPVVHFGPHYRPL